MKNPIKFGTDGWRAVIAKDYTFENLARVSAATAAWIKSSGITKNGVVIGYDGRFMGRSFAWFTARVLASEGIRVKIADRMAPTPAVSWAAGEYKAIGVVITASHNPPEYNGFKLKAPFGGPATPAQISEVEKLIPDDYDSSGLKSVETLMDSGFITEIALTDLYLDVLRDKIDLELISKSGIRILHDAMFGATAGLTEALLDSPVVSLRNDDNPGFHGTAPEPIEKNLTDVPEVIRETGCDLGIANDGDGDRVGMFDENGTYVDSHQILSLLLKYLHKNKGMTGGVIKTFSTTDMLRKQAEAYGLEVQTTPIGFKYIAEKIITEDVLVCGEESGGIAVKGHIPERDGLYIGLKVAEMCAASGKSLSTLVQELFDEFGEHQNRRNDLHTTEEKKNAFVRLCKEGKLETVDGKKVVKREFLDGIKHWMDDDSWLLVRPSGTEPVLRIYSEATSGEQAQRNVDDVSARV